MPAIGKSENKLLKGTQTHKDTQTKQDNIKGGNSR